MSAAFDALGRLEGPRRRVIHQMLGTDRAGVVRVRMSLECGHVERRRYNGTRAIWAICQECGKQRGR